MKLVVSTSWSMLDSHFRLPPRTISTIVLKQLKRVRLFNSTGLCVLEPRVLVDSVNMFCTLHFECRHDVPVSTSWRKHHRRKKMTWGTLHSVFSRLLHIPLLAVCFCIFHTVHGCYALARHLIDIKLSLWYYLEQWQPTRELDILYDFLPPCADFSRRKKSQLSVVPKHLGIILECDAEVPFTQLAKLFTWVLAVGVREITLHDANGSSFVCVTHGAGKLKGCKNKIQQEIFTATSNYFGAKEFKMVIRKSPSEFVTSKTSQEILRFNSHLHPHN